MIEDYSVVYNPEFLHESHIPTEIAQRESKMKELSQCLKPAFKKQKPMHAWLYGDSGTGKTLIARYILKKIEKEAYTAGVYINCWEHNSYYSVLDKLVRELKILGAEKLDTSFKLERLRKFIGNKPFIIILDEIDQVKEPEREAILYNLCNIGNIGLICITNSRSVIYSLDDRIKSRLNVKQIVFNPYIENGLIDILRQRAEYSFSPGSWSDKTLKSIARLSKGDSRIAIQILRNAAYNAEKDHSRTIELKHVKEGYHLSEDLKKSYLLDRLNSHQRILYELVKGKKEINSGDLWKIYLVKCRTLKKQPIAVRTYSEYMNKLIELGLVQWERALVRGKVRVFRVVD